MQNFWVSFTERTYVFHKGGIGDLHEGGGGRGLIYSPASKRILFGICLNMYLGVWILSVHVNGGNSDRVYLNVDTRIKWIFE